MYIYLMLFDGFSPKNVEHSSEFVGIQIERSSDWVFKINSE